MVPRCRNKWLGGELVQCSYNLMNFLILKDLRLEKYNTFYHSIKHTNFVKSFFIYTSNMDFSVTQVQISMVRI